MGPSIRQDWHQKPWYSLDAWCKNVYGHKLYKVALDIGCSCPNRDGATGTGGCTFCSAGGSSVLMLYICVGLVLSVYMHNKKKLFS